MKMLPLQAAMAAALLSVAIGVSAKPLVVCTEASPEGFDPVLYTTAVTADSKIFVTATTSTDGQTPYVIEKVDKTSFKVKIDAPAAADITFDWFIIN